MSAPKKVAVIVGSLRKASFSRKLARALIGMAPASLSMHIVEIGELPLYDQDHEATPPVAWTVFREQVADCDALLFVTPEYNRSVPGALKNAIDVGSRPYARNAWSAKPGAVISVSPGAMGGFGANHHLRQSLTAVNVPVMQQPEAYIGGIDKMFDDRDVLTNESTRAFLDKFLQALSRWATANGPGVSPNGLQRQAKSRRPRASRAQPLPYCRQ